MSAENQTIATNIQMLKELIKKEKNCVTKMRSGEDLMEIEESSRLLEGKLVGLKLEFAQRSEEIEEIKDNLIGISNVVSFQDLQIMKLQEEIEKINESIEENRETHKPPRASLGSPRNPILLLKKK